MVFLKQDLYEFLVFLSFFKMLDEIWILFILAFVLTTALVTIKYLSQISHMLSITFLRRTYKILKYDPEFRRFHIGRHQRHKENNTYY